MQNLLEILETQREGFVRELGSAPTPEIRAAFQAEVDAVDAKIVAEKARREEEQQKVEEVAQEFADALDMITLGGYSFDLRGLAKGEEEAQVLRAWSTEQMTRNAQKFLREISTIKAEMEAKLAAKDAVINTLNAEVDTLKEDNAGLADSFDEMAEQIKDREEKLAEQEKEISRLNSHVDDLRGQIALGNSRPVIDVNTGSDWEAIAQRLKEKQEAEAKAAEEAKQAAKPRIYNVRPADALGRNNLANLATTGEEITIPYLEMYKYVVLANDAEVSRFREEQALKIPETVADDIALVVMPIVEAPRFQDENGSGNDGEGVQGGAGVVGGYVSQAKFEALQRGVEALQRRVEAVEGYIARVGG